MYKKRFNKRKSPPKGSHQKGKKAVSKWAILGFNPDSSYFSYFFHGGIECKYQSGNR